MNAYLAAAGLAVLAILLAVGAFWVIGFDWSIEDELEPEEAPEPIKLRARVRAGGPYCNTSLLGLEKVRREATAAAVADFHMGTRTSNSWPVGSPCAITWTTSYGLSWMECEDAARAGWLPAKNPAPAGDTNLTTS